MSVWLTIPSARKDLGTIPVWRELGYHVAIWLDCEPKEMQREYIDHLKIVTIVGRYPGYARAVNALVSTVIELDPEAQWFVCGGDDTLPDYGHSPQEIAAECTEHFGGTFGVMQPTGDRFASGSIDRIAGSPWMGREWCERAHRGLGPLCPEFTHMFVDEALKEISEKLGVYWMRPDLVHLHRHFMRESDELNAKAISKPIPDHLREWNSTRHWNHSRAILDRLRKENFESCMPLAR